MNSYIYVLDEKRDWLQDYSSGGYTYTGADPLPRVGDRLYTEWVGQAKWNAKKGDKIRCFEYEVSHITFNYVKHEIQVYCLVIKDEFRWWKYKEKKNDSKTTKV